MRPIPAPSLRPWAGARLGAVGAGVGELWLAGPASVVDIGEGPTTLDELAVAAGEAFLGDAAMHLLGPRFPLIVKLIDAAEWLSLQVHPDDALASELYGPRALGKAEAWLVLGADANTRLVTGPRHDLGEQTLRSEIEAGTLGREHCEELVAKPGDVLMLEPGTLHAIGAGAFVYEIEQPSDLTFRMSDWGRPPTPGRTLHLEESLRAVRSDAHARPVGHDWHLDDGELSVREFRLEIAHLQAPVTRRPAGRSLEVVTAIGAPIRVTGDGWAEVLDLWETIVVPASVAEYRLDGEAASMACFGSIPTQ
ncbi:MAG: type I phosphomannose isomerase catalytic subunit [Chloroflexota bacterium]